jgi:transcriptional enhancer factor
MNGSFHQGFDVGSQQVQEPDMRHPSISFMSVTSSGDTESSYLAANTGANSGYSAGVYEEVPQDFQGWVTAATTANSIPAVENRLHPGYWQPQPQYNSASRHVPQPSVLDWAVPSPHDSPIAGQPMKTEGAIHAALGQTEQWQGKDPTPISADTSPRPLTDCSSRESQERQGSWVNVPVGVAGRTPSTDLSQDWEAINQSHEAVEPAMKLQTVGEGQPLMSDGYFPHQAVPVQEMAPNGHEAQYERFRGHKRRRMFVDDYSIGQQRMKMARTDNGE